MTKPVRNCSVEGCGARAWHDDLCNYHALEQLRSGPAPKPRAAKVQEGKQVLRQRAKELGIVLESEPEKVTVASKASRRSKGRPKKRRSPVG